MSDLSCDATSWIINSLLNIGNLMTRFVTVNRGIVGIIFACLNGAAYPAIVTAASVDAAKVNTASVNEERHSLGLDWKAPLALDHPLTGAIYDSRGVLTPEALGLRMGDSRYLLIGEKHDNVDHHQLELYLLELLVKSPAVGDTAVGNTAIENSVPSVAIALEMLDSSQQTKINSVAKQLKADNTGIDAAELKRRLDWPERGWPWSDYAAIIGWTFARQIPLYAGNISRQTMRTVHQNGLDDRFQSARQLRSTLRDSILDQVFDGHCGLLAKDSLAPMLDIQLAKDSAMANAMANALASTDAKQSVLIAGTGHTRKDTGVPKHLRLVGAEPVLSIALIEVDPEKRKVSDYDLFDQYDVVIFTPVANQRDYCAEFKKSMQNNK